MTPLKFVKIVFRNFVLLNAPELFFYPFSQTKSDLVKLILSVRGTTFRNTAYLVRSPPSMFAVVFRTPSPYLSFARFPPFPLLGGVIAVKRESKHLGLWRVGISARRGQLD